MTVLYTHTLTHEVQKGVHALLSPPLFALHPDSASPMPG